MNPVQIKICGVTCKRDAEKSAQLGVEMIGFNFYGRSPRYIEPSRAREIIEAMPERICAVGIFVEPSVEEVRAIAPIASLNCVQLHGNVPSETCRELAQQFRVIRALRTGNGFLPEKAKSFGEVLIDADHSELHGGTGQTCNWGAARATRAFARFLILSGGLNSENVMRAIAAVAPDAVDVCSGVESAAGIKDHGALEEFVAAVR